MPNNPCMTTARQHLCVVGDPLILRAAVRHETGGSIRTSPIWPGSIRRTAARQPAERTLTPTSTPNDAYGTIGARPRHDLHTDSGIAIRTTCASATGRRCEQQPRLGTDASARHAAGFSLPHHRVQFERGNLRPARDDCKSEASGDGPRCRDHGRAHGLTLRKVSSPAARGLNVTCVAVTSTAMPTPSLTTSGSFGTINATNASYRKCVNLGTTLSSRERRTT